MADKKEKPRTLRRDASAQAYTLVDLSGLHPETRKDIMLDAGAGGGTYGIRVVEEAVNGGSRAPIYGYYKNGPDAERWDGAKKELGIDADEIPDGEVKPIDVEVIDPRREAALREAAAQRAAGEADRIRAGEVEAIRSITGDEDGESPTPNMSATRSGATDHHTTNIVDSTLSEDATNDASEAGSSEEAEDNRRTSKKTNKAPK